jgi:hypothetical protein
VAVTLLLITAAQLGVALATPAAPTLPGAVTVPISR